MKMPGQARHGGETLFAFVRAAVSGGAPEARRHVASGPPRDTKDPLHCLRASCRIPEAGFPSGRRENVNFSHRALP
jgi:hypothetical protein